MWMFEQVLHAPCGEGFWGGFGGGGLIPFVWMFRSCGCFVHVDVAVMSFLIVLQWMMNVFQRGVGGGGVIDVRCCMQTKMMSQR